MTRNHIPAMQRKNAGSSNEQEPIQHRSSQHPVLSLQRLIGNQATQQMLVQNGSIQRSESEEQETESSGRFSTGWERFKDKIGFGADNEKVLKEFKGSLDKAKKYCEYGSYALPDGEIKDAVKQAAEQFGGVSGNINELLEISETVGDVLAFIDAVEAVAEVDIEKNPDQAAVAFGKLFGTAGKLGEMLPEGPWTAYFQFIGKMETFFTDVMRGINPYARTTNGRGKLLYDLVHHPNRL